MEGGGQTLVTVGGGNSGVGAIVGGDNSGGGCPQPLRTDLHNISRSPKQFELKQS